MIFDGLFFTQQYKSRGFGLEHTLTCALQIQEPSDFPSECTGSVSFLYPQHLMGYRKLFHGFSRYNSYTKLNNDIITYHEYDLAFFDKV